jgi:hypothetical protein
VWLCGYACSLCLARAEGRWEEDERESAGEEAETVCEEAWGRVGDETESNKDARNTAGRGEGEPVRSPARHRRRRKRTGRREGRQRQRRVPVSISTEPCPCLPKPTSDSPPRRPSLLPCPYCSPLLVLGAYPSAYGYWKGLRSWTAKRPRKSFPKGEAEDELSASGTPQSPRKRSARDAGGEACTALVEVETMGDATLMASLQNWAPPARSRDR